MVDSICIGCRHRFFCENPEKMKIIDCFDYPRLTLKREVREDVSYSE